jgi:predicted component of type VI protein secretion system
MNDDATSRRLPRVELEIVRGRARNKLRRVDVPVFLIGSARDCDLVLCDADFPEIHTYLYVNRGGVSVRRIAESPALAVDGREVQSATIVDGQMLRLGRYEFEVHIDRPMKVEPADEGDEKRRSTAPSYEETEHPGLALVRALLDDIRTALKMEANLQLYSDQDLPWQTITGNQTLLVRKASA